MASIRLISTSRVQATSSPESSTQRIELTSSDLKLFLFGSIQKGLLFPKPKPNPSSEVKRLDETLIQQLKNSLSRTPAFSTPLAGRLAIEEHDDETASFFIECNNAGIQFVHAVADDITISDILEPIYVPPFVHSFFPLNGVRNYEGVSKPLLAVQVTELVDGIFIACTMNHSVADGTTFWNFFNSWSEISRKNSDRTSKPPVIEHWFRSHCTIRLPLSIFRTENGIIPTSPSFQERVFHFSKEKIAGLKAQANAEAGCEKISSLQSVLAHLWLSVIRNRQLIDPNQETNFHLMVGIRSRLQPPLPGEYFGNAVQGVTVTLKAREVIKQGLGYTALEMNRMVNTYTEDKVRKVLESSIQQPKILKMDGIPQDDLAASSSPRFNVYGNDFGWGKPIAVRSGPENKFCVKITVFPGVEEGSMDTEVCTFLEILEAMGHDSEFMAAVN
ncbi:hypothetical protein P3X46_018758 [Hevea brasiliensis]|uniref:HXXXD-type acyl-transferase family protein n=1 Tax=Hevea brasiliensis TaxID=3981 RepID=A0ABQ9LRN5_HEVBR|nr:uncharacterized acetyltransferase At3g50280-like [Hevea brasiliensis]KAJ9170666.1 hypothetical protein P3X46_018758 [Hevea brasiliensis]